MSDLEIKRENTEPCDSNTFKIEVENTCNEKGDVKTEMKEKNEWGDFGQEKNDQIQESNKRICPYDDFDDDDDEQFQPSKFRKYNSAVHTESHKNKTKLFEGISPEEEEDIKVKVESSLHSSSTDKILGIDLGCENSGKQELGTIKKDVEPEEARQTASSDNSQGVSLSNEGVEHSEQGASTGGIRVVYIHNDELINHCNRLTRITGRAGMVHSLIDSLGLLRYCQPRAPVMASREEVLTFHAEDYVDYLQRISDLLDEEQLESEELVNYGITYDCPVQQGVYECAALVAGATMTGARALCDGSCDVAINWCGGWHHAQRSEASGFCYINDIVLGILTLRQRFSRVLYIDLDVHHGDGVENAFSTTPHVMTVSFHKFEPGFFPGTGSVKDVGSGRGKYYSVNVPMNDGMDDRSFFFIFMWVMSHVQEAYSPQVVVCQCGADALAGDPMASFNLTPLAYQQCLLYLMKWKVPLLLLGGGGYHHPNTARLWASLTALTVGKQLPQDVPDHRYFTEYGPDYELTVQAGNRKNTNTKSDLKHICFTIRENLKNIQSKPV